MARQKPNSVGWEERLASLPQARLALLLGSRARGTADPDSDVDVAVLAAWAKQKSGS